ncbi:MAG: FmdB family transcriptional regulator [Firmicutes bacterium ZCTH02-B6]|nr:MAG: FmdB family transcriptional regulator [Firmicutes bacterium ZCTH02-B6]
MPTYEYRCEQCGKFDYFQAITDAPLSTCPTCGQPVRRLISRNVNIIFKGPGFHITDYRKSGGAGGSSSRDKEDSGEESKSSVADEDLD